MYLIPILVKAFERLINRNHGLQIIIKWVPGHEGAMGNEIADKEASKAVRLGSSPAKLIP